MPQTFLTDRERRVVAHLAIPRNLEDLAQQLREDQFAPSLDVATLDGAADLKDGNGQQVPTLAYLMAEDMVVKLPDPGGDVAKMMSVAQDRKATIDLADEQALILERRLQHPSRAWRVDGPHYMISREGLERVKAPIPGTGDGRLSEEQLAAVIRASYDRVILDVDFRGSILDQGDGPNDPRAGGILLDGNGKPFEGGDGPGLADRLLPEEFRIWMDQVVEDMVPKGRRNAFIKSLNLEARGGNWADAYENIVIDAENQKTSITAAAPWHMALTILAFTDADTGTTADDANHKPTYTGYARKAVAAADMAAASGGSAANANAITFADCTAGSSTIVGIGHCDAATLGVLRKYATTASTTVSTTATPATLNAGAYTTSAN